MPRPHVSQITAPHPFSWRSAYFRSITALAVVVLAVRLVWGWHVRRLLDAQFDEIRRRGEPVEVAELKFEDVPQERNAWTLQTRAAQAQATGVDSPKNGNLEYPNYPPFPAEWRQMAEASERVNAPVFSLARQARQYAGVQIHAVPLTSPMYATLLPYLNTMRQLANTLADGAIYAQVRGDDAEAVERAADLFHLARSVHHDEFLVSQLVAIGIEAVACNTAQILAPGLRFAPGGSTTRPADRARVRALLGRVLDDRDAWQGLRHNLVVERLGVIDSDRWQATGTWFIQPLADLDILRNNRNFEIAMRAAMATNAPQAQATLAAMSERPLLMRPWSGRLPAGLPRYSRWFHLAGENFSHYFDAYFRMIAERRATAVSLAAQLFRADHRRWPNRLDELVPEYLPAVPIDPFHDDGRPLGYVILQTPGAPGVQRPMMYFDAGDVTDPVIRDEPMYEWRNDSRRGKMNRRVRQYRDLSRFVPPPVADATQPATLPAANPATAPSPHAVDYHP